MTALRFVRSSLLMLALLAVPFVAEAAEKVSLIGMLDYSAPDAARVGWWKAFRQALRELGHVEGQSVAFEARWADGRVGRLPGLAAELVRLRVDVIVTGGSEAARAAKQASVSIPIVMATGADPVALGLVESLARPGGNVTGVTSISTELSGKRLELLRVLLPTLSRVAILWDEANSASALGVRETEAVAPALGMRLQSVGLRDPKHIDRAFSAVVGERAGALIVAGGASLFPERKRIADLALKHQLPTMVTGREYAEAGGLLSYAVSYPDLFRRAALYVDRILKGARPADLPVEQPTKFELIINLQTAKALRLTLPPSLLARTDQVIE
jgi:putative ABC transport system substrate-binding protein